MLRDDVGLRIVAGVKPTLHPDGKLGGWSIGGGSWLARNLGEECGPKWLSARLQSVVRRSSHDMERPSHSP